MRRVAAGALLAGTMLSVLAATPTWGGFVPGGGSKRTDCYAGLYVGRIDNPSPQVKRNRIVSCTDGDPCDRDYGPRGCGNDSCAFQIAVCAGQTYPDLPACPSVALREISYQVRRLGVPGRDFEPDYIPRRSLLSTAIPWGYGKGPGPTCGAPVDMDVQARVTRDGRKLPGRLEISLEAIAKDSPTSAVDHDRIILVCLPRTTPCPDAEPPTTTTTTLPGLSTNPTIIVGAGGGVRFEPDTVRIRAGDTVRWLWESKGSALSSEPEGLFCSPCPLNRAGATFEHTFPDAGTFPFLTEFGFPMEGRVIVEP
jgi:plastocyanin